MALLPWEDQRLPVSMRLNNPGAMNFGPFARGHGARQSGRFAQFDTPEAGWAAMDALLNSYRSRGFNTPSSIVGRWAPRGVDNNSTDAYIGRVAGGLGIGPNDPVPDAQWGNLAQLMANYEAGRSNPRPTPPAPLGATPNLDSFGRTTRWGRDAAVNTLVGGSLAGTPNLDLLGQSMGWGRNAVVNTPIGDSLAATPNLDFLGQMRNRAPTISNANPEDLAGPFPTISNANPADLMQPPAVPPFQVTDIQPGSGEISTGDIVASMGPQPQPPGPDADSIMRQATAAHDRNNPPGPPEPGYLDRLLNNRAFLMGMSILGTPPGGNWGASAINATRAHREGLEFERQQQQRSVMDRVWREAFPNGQPNPQHPLMQGIPSEMAATIHAMGPEQGLPQLQRFAFFRGQQAEQLNQQQRRLEMALNMAGNRGQQPQQPQLGLPSMNPAIGNMLPDAQPGQPQTLDAAPLASPGMPWSVPGAPSAAPGPQVAPAQQGPEPMVTILGRQMPLSAARTLTQAFDVAGNRLESGEQAVTAAEAPQRAGETRLATERAQIAAQNEQRTSTARDAWGILDEMEGFANRLGNDRLSAAASPALDTTTGAWTLGIARQQAWNDRQLLLPYLEQLTLLARGQLRGQGTISDSEARTIERALSAARNATSPDAFYDAIEVTRSILARSIPDQAGYRPTLRTLGDRPRQSQTRQQPTQERPMQPPQAGTGTTDTDELTPEMAGRRVYDSKTGRWGYVDQTGRFRAGFGRALPSFMYGQ